MRIGTWNLDLRSSAPRPDWTHKAAWLDQQAAHLWLLTEVHGSWNPRGNSFALSPERSRMPENGRWAAIETSQRLGELLTSADSGHAGEEGLVLARVQLEGQSVLVACSVLPWNGAREYWGGLPTGQFNLFRAVLDHHVARIVAERLPAEPLVWGGDLNQPLVPPFAGGSKDEALVLCSALDYLGLTSLTQGLGSRNRQMHAIDHIAVSSDFLAERVETHRPVREDGSNMSDHAAYIADVHLVERRGEEASYSDVRRERQR